MSGTPPRPLEVLNVEKHARMAERGHAAVAAASRFSGTLPCGPYHIVLNVLDVHDGQKSAPGRVGRREPPPDHATQAKNTVRSGVLETALPEPASLSF